VTESDDVVVGLAPVTGTPVAELVAREPPSHDLALVDPNRFAGLASLVRRM
jgi:hypothetical protein